MTITADSIAKIALARVRNARDRASEISGYSSSEAALTQVKLDLDIAAELLGLIAQPPADASA